MTFFVALESQSDNVDVPAGASTTASAVFARTLALRSGCLAVGRRYARYVRGAAAPVLSVFAGMPKAEGAVAWEAWHGQEISEKKGGFFVDLFVRVSDQVAVNTCKQLGYGVYWAVLEYCSASSGETGAYRRKALSRDTEKKSVIPLPHSLRPEDTE
uniref:Uncharacterized protein n=1 Tax=Bubo bubo TaxID=30461 RepID=A0A8C0FCJ4_BUBBB